MKPNPNTALRDKIVKLLKEQDWGYEYRMSDYAGSREKEAEYEAEGLANIEELADQILKIIQDNQEPKDLLEDFAEFCHEHYMGCSHEAGEDWAYSYDKEIVHLVPEYLDRPNQQEEKTL